MRPPSHLIWIFNLRFCLGLALFVCLQISACSLPPRDDQKLAQWGDGHSVTVGDFKKILKREKENYSPETLKDQEDFLKIKKRLLNEYIENQLLLQEAQAQGIQISEEELAQELGSYKSEYTEIGFRKVLEEQGITYEDWIQTKRENLLVKKYLMKLAEQDSTVSEEEIKKYYQEHTSEFQVPESVWVRQIVTDTKEKAESIMRRLKNGENFAKLARDLSIAPDRKQGGDLGFIRRGSFPRTFEVCFSMNPGEISPIIPSFYGFHIFKIIEKKPERTLGLEEVKERIALRLRQESRQRARQKQMDQLKAKAQIKLEEDLLKRVRL